MIVVDTGVCEVLGLVAVGITALWLTASTLAFAACMFASQANQDTERQEQAVGTNRS